MPDPALPIIGFCLALVNFYGGFRSGVEVIYREYQESKTYKNDVEIIKSDLITQKEKLEEWRNKWMLWEGCPGWLLDKFWSQNGRQKIENDLRILSEQCSKIGKKLKAYENVGEEDWARRNWFTRSYQKRAFVWVRQRYLLDQLDKNAKMMTQLENTAQSHWKTTRRIDSAYQFDAADVRRFGERELLVKMAKSLWIHAETIWQSCSAAHEQVSMSLDLDILGVSKIAPREQYMRYLVQIYAQEHTPLNILTRRLRAGTSGATTVSFVVTREENAHCVPLSGALLSILDGRVKGSERQHCTVNQLTISLSRSTEQKQENQSVAVLSVRQLVLSVRQLQTSTGTTNFKNPNWLGFVPKYRLAFELTQACFLFLQTSWIGSICTCKVLRSQFSSDHIRAGHEDHFALSMDGKEHLACGWKNASQAYIRSREWDPFTVPVRHLGIMLVEIMLGAVVSNVQCATGHITHLVFSTIMNGAFRSHPRGIADVLSAVKIAARLRPFVQVVRYCLTSTTNDSSTEQRLLSLYDNTLAPMKAEYEKLFSKELQRMLDRGDISLTDSSESHYVTQERRSKGYFYHDLCARNATVA